MASDQCACGAYYEDGQWWMRWRERGHTHEPIDWRLPALKEDSDASIPD